MKKKTPSKAKKKSSNPTTKKSPSTKKKPSAKKKPGAKKKSATKKKSSAKKKPVAKKSAGRKKSSAKKKPTAKKKPATGQSRSPKKPAKDSASKGSGRKKPAAGKKTPTHRAVEKKHSSSSARPRILPADTPFPAKFTEKSNKAIAKYVYNKNSSIHGMGAFAKSRIPKGAYVGSYEGVPSLDDDIYVLWVEQDNGSWRGIDGKNELRYLNHSSRPNVEWNENRLYSIRAIEPHEELTFHYGDEWDDVD